MSAQKELNNVIDLKELVRKLLSKWHYFVLALLVTLPLAFVYNKIALRIYKVRATILLKNETGRMTDADDFLKGLEFFRLDTELEDEIGALTSFSIIDKAVRQLDFGISYYVKKDYLRTIEKYGDQSFTIELDSIVDHIIGVPIYITRLPNDQYAVKASAKKVPAYNFYTNDVEDFLASFEVSDTLDIGEPFVSKNLSFTINFDDRFPIREDEQAYFVINHLESVAESYRHRLQATPLSRESNIVEVTIEGSVPHKEIVFVSTLMDVYLENELYEKNQLGLRTISFIDNQLKDVSDSLDNVESSLQSFRSRNRIIDINATSENLNKKLDELLTDQAETEVRLKYYQYLENYLQNDNDTENVLAPSTVNIDDPLLNALLLELSKLNQERTQLTYNTREKNPLTEVLDLKISNTEKSLLENVKGLIGGTKITLEDLKRRVERIRVSISRLPQNERELVNIQRRFTFSDNVYNYLLQKRAEAGIAIASNTVDKTVVDEPRIVGNGPIAPNTKFIYLGALLLGLAAPIGLIIIKDFLNDNIANQEDLKKNTSIPLIGMIGHAKNTEISNGVVPFRSPLAEAFRSVRVNLQYLTLGKTHNVIGITSSMPREGKTFCSVNMAASLAQSGHSTVIIDADMRKPQISRKLGLNGQSGLSTYLVGQCTLQQLIQETKIKNLYAITAGPIPPNPLDLLSLERFGELIRELKKNFDSVIIDSPPLGDVSEYIILMQYTDTNIYVVRSGYTNKYLLDRINQLYEEEKMANVSILLNDVKSGFKSGYYYQAEG